MYYFIPNLSKYAVTSVNLLLFFYWVHFLQLICNLTLFRYAMYKDEKHQMSRAKGKRSESSPLFFNWNSWFSYSVLSPPCYGSPGEGYILKSRVHQILFYNSPSENGLLCFAILWEMTKLLLTAPSLDVENLMKTRYFCSFTSNASDVHSYSASVKFLYFSVCLVWWWWFKLWSLCTVICSPQTKDTAAFIKICKSPALVINSYKLASLMNVCSSAFTLKLHLLAHKYSVYIKLSKLFYDS